MNIEDIKVAAFSYASDILSEDLDVNILGKLIESAFTAGALFSQAHHTKYQLGDTVYCLCDNKVYTCTITAVESLQTKHSKDIKYKIRYPSGGESYYSENKLFSSKKELLESL